MKKTRRFRGGALRVNNVWIAARVVRIFRDSPCFGASVIAAAFCRRSRAKSDCKQPQALGGFGEVRLWM